MAKIKNSQRIENFITLLNHPFWKPKEAAKYILGQDRTYVYYSISFSTINSRQKFENEEKEDQIRILLEKYISKGEKKLTPFECIKIVKNAGINIDSDLLKATKIFKQKQNNINSNLKTDEESLSNQDWSYKNKLIMFKAVFKVIDDPAYNFRGNKMWNAKGKLNISKLASIVDDNKSNLDLPEDKRGFSEKTLTNLLYDAR